MKQQLKEREEDEGCVTGARPLEMQLDIVENDDDYAIESVDDTEDDEHTIEEDEALITEEERREELAALHDEVNLSVDEILRRYQKNVSREDGLSGEHMVDQGLKSEKMDQDSEKQADSSMVEKDFQVEDNLSSGCKDDILLHEVSGDDYPSVEVIVPAMLLGSKIKSKQPSLLQKETLSHDSGDEMNDNDYVLAAEEKDDETTLVEEEELAKREAINPLREIELLKQESELPIEELLARYKKDIYAGNSEQPKSASVSLSSDDVVNYAGAQHSPCKSQVAASDDFEENIMKNVQRSGGSLENINMKLPQEPEERESEDIIADAAAAARSAQPTGNTFSTTKVRTKLPFLLKHPLREYQHIGLDWLVTMYEKRLNGILADEMGLGKTIMTISLLAHLACEKGLWGPHLIVVPTSVMLNWETEFLKWCPAFKILTYFGNAKERKHKRQGWLKPNSFHVCITTYRLVIQDSKVFKRKKWKYLILDEAHLIKNWKSQRWQTLLNFNAKRRILLTGTPLQNDLMELWSLMHFLMPHVFQSHQEFKDWFSNPITGMVEGQEKVNKEVVDRLHNVLRPFILRRLKRDVEKQLPKKHEHVIYCRLSRRQRNLYEDFIASSETQATLASANFFGMISVIMQLRKVCNHPDLFEGRPIISSFDMAGIDLQLSSSVCTMFSAGPFSKVDLDGLNLVFTQNDFHMTSWEVDKVAALCGYFTIHKAKEGNSTDQVASTNLVCDEKRRNYGANIFEEIQKTLLEERMKQVKERAASIAWWNSLQCRKKPVYGANLRELVTIRHPVLSIHEKKRNPFCYLSFSSKLSDIVLSPLERFEKMLEIVESFMFAIPAARAPNPVCWCTKRNSHVFLSTAFKDSFARAFSPLMSSIRPAIVRKQVYFPDRRLIQFDCGKLQKLAILLRRLKTEGHRALIFTQMTKMLDILEAFINLYGYTYLRLDGSTQPEERQTLMQRFNTNPKFFLFILSTRSGGVGINLVGADTVIFYDSDWNPAMDQQAQDRCHRIGQTREVHIYRLISESTIEENILKKANQKRALDDLVIQSGSYNTEFFKKLDPMELFSGHRSLQIGNSQNEESIAIDRSEEGMVNLSNADVEAALKQAEDEIDYMALKRVEQEEAVESQEFAEEAVGKFEDDEFVNNDDAKPDEKNVTVDNTDTKFDDSTVRKLNNVSLGANFAGDQNCWLSTTSAFNKLSLESNDNALQLAGREDDIDMLADVKQMAAAAAAAGQASSSFENHLRPIDRYAMRYLVLWDPIIDKSAIEDQDSIEEHEWELDRIEKFKDDLEAEIDEDEEPFLYERWDADVATEAYRQHVEALAQQQLIEEECEVESQNADDGTGDTRIDTIVEHKPKMKNLKKAKFKSLKKRSLSTELEAMKVESSSCVFAEDKIASTDVSCPTSPSLSLTKKKRKSPISTGDEKASRTGFKKLKKDSENKHTGALEVKSGEKIGKFNARPTVKKKVGKISITAMPLKRMMVIKHERCKRRGYIWSKDLVPLPDSWSSPEDAILCAVVHEYGSNWSLVSDVLYSMTTGGCYRGRYRHPANCCDRFRELFFKYFSYVPENPNADKITTCNSSKVLLRVTEDQVGMLLSVASEQPDIEFLLQKHFTAVVSSLWRAKYRNYCHHNFLYFRNGFLSNASSCFKPGRKTRRFTEKMNLTILRQSSKLVAAALNNVGKSGENRGLSTSAIHQEVPNVSDKLDLTLEFPAEVTDCSLLLPSVITVSISSPQQMEEQSYGQDLLHIPSSIADDRFRLASEACLEGEVPIWATSAFSTGVVRHRSTLMPQLGKHRSANDAMKLPKSKVPRVTGPEEPSVMSESCPAPCGQVQIDVDSFDDRFTADGWIEAEGDYSLSIDLLNIAPHTNDELPHEYNPEFIANLDELESLPDVTDIG